MAKFQAYDAALSTNLADDDILLLADQSASYQNKKIVLSELDKRWTPTDSFAVATIGTFDFAQISTPSATQAGETWLKTDTGEVFVSSGSGTGNWGSALYQLVLNNTSTPISLGDLDLGGTLSSLGALPITIGTSAGNDFTINSTHFVVEGDTGYAGFGTAAPSRQVEVRIDDSTVLSATVRPEGLKLYNVNTTVNTGVGIYFQCSSTGAGEAAIEAMRPSATNSELVFKTESADDFRERMRISKTVYIGDTANAKMTQGLTINQGANDDEILALKSSDVAHGMTDLAETDTFGYMKKSSPGDGGLHIDGISEGTIGFHLSADCATFQNTDTTASVGGILVSGQKKSGTTVGAYAADENVIALRNYTTTRWLMKGDGSWFNFLPTETFAMKDAGSAGATEQDWVEVTIGGVTGYIRIYAAK